jgi:hypothetical protein
MQQPLAGWPIFSKYRINMKHLGMANTERTIFLNFQFFLYFFVQNGKLVERLGLLADTLHFTVPQVFDGVCSDHRYLIYTRWRISFSKIEAKNIPAVTPI